jgi:hypothetical protein
METRTTPTGTFPGELPEITPVGIQQEWPLPLHPVRSGFHDTVTDIQLQPSILHNRTHATIKTEISICAIELRNVLRHWLSDSGKPSFRREDQSGPVILNALSSEKRKKLSLTG